MGMERGQRGKRAASRTVVVYECHLIVAHEHPGKLTIRTRGHQWSETGGGERSTEAVAGEGGGELYFITWEAPYVSKQEARDGMTPVIWHGHITHISLDPTPWTRHLVGSMV